MDRYRKHAMKDEAREIVRNVKELGSHAAQAAREWINERKNDMNNRNDRNEYERTQATSERNESNSRYEPRAQWEREPSSASRSSYDAQSYRQPEFNQNEPMRGYGYGASQGAQGTYGVHQREDMDYANRERNYAGELREGDRSQGAYAQRASYDTRSQQGFAQERYGSPYATQSSQSYASQQSQGGYSSNPQRSYAQGYGAGDDGSQNYGTSAYGNSASATSASMGYAPSSSAQYGQGYGMTGTADRMQGQGYGQSSSYGVSTGYGAQQYGVQDTRGNRDAYGSSAYGTYGQPQGLHHGKGPKGYTRSDERIREDLNERLYHAGDIDASDIELNVSGGVVTLSGTVDERRLKYRIEDMAESCSGVKDVTNNLRVRNSASRSNEDIRTAGQSGGSLGGSDTGVDLKGTRSTASTGKTLGNSNS